MRLLSLSIAKRLEYSAGSQVKSSMSRSNRWRQPKGKTREKGTRSLSSQQKMGHNVDYSAWSQEKLIERVTALEQELKIKNESSVITPLKKSWKKPRNERPFDPSRYCTRLVAFKLAYLGKNYNGYEHSSGHATPLTTIEEELWRAFTTAKLLIPKDDRQLVSEEVNWDGTEYSKCGRTDKGVSAFGQVIGIRVRSARPLERRKNIVEATEQLGAMGEDGENKTDNPTIPVNPPLQEIENISLDVSDSGGASEFDPVKDELQYCTILNKLLPPDIRILAWCPFPPADFNARFDCAARHYKYFFTNPCFAPVPGNLEAEGSLSEAMKDGWLDIEAMKEAAQLLEGEHDFRNLCKVDPGKQITNFKRSIYHTSITEHLDRASGAEYVRDAGLHPEGGDFSKHPKVYTFNLHGSAFLWHQVRHIVAVLFAVGQGLEKPSIVSELLDAQRNPTKPLYEMASDTPLILWDCVFRDEQIQWHYVGDGIGNGDVKYGPDGLMDNLWKVWHERKMDELLAASLMNEVYRSGVPVKEMSTTKTRPGKSQKVFDGGSVPRLQGKYVPVMKKPRTEDVPTINERYAIKKGFKSSEDMKNQMIKKRNGVMDEEADE